MPNSKEDKPAALREVIREMVNELKATNKEIIQEQKLLNIEIYKLAHTVYGNKEAGHPGHAGEIKSHKEQLEEVKTWKNRFIGGVAVLSALLTFLGILIGKLFK